MSVYLGKALLFICLFLSFLLLFYWMRKESFIHVVLHKAYDGMETAARKRVLNNRRSMRLLEKRGGRLYGLEKMLLYSGLLRRFPLLSPERFVAGGAVVSAILYFLLLLAGLSYAESLLCVLGLHVAVYIGLTMRMQKNYNATDENLLKFLDFLGSYSLTGGEVMGVFKQISVYLEEPMRGALEECYYEALLTGDTTLALLSTAEKLQHPKFKELIRNIEISGRYVTDYSALVIQSRRSIREHMRLRAERKSLAKEAWTNMLLLGAMALIILKSVEVLIGVPMGELLFHSVVGRICMAGIVIILGLFYVEVKNIDG